MVERGIIDDPKIIAGLADRLDYLGVQQRLGEAAGQVIQTALTKELMLDMPPSEVVSGVAGFIMAVVSNFARAWPPNERTRVVSVLMVQVSQGLIKSVERGDLKTFGPK